MGQFNKSTKNSRKTTSYEGGVAYTKTLENEWVNALFSLMLNRRNDQFYRSSKDAENRFIDITYDMIEKYGAEFVGKAAIYVRNELGLRSVSEVVAAILNRYTWLDTNITKREFYSKYFRRPDGIGEVFSIIDELGDKRSHGLIRGCADYLSTLNEYTLGKYKLTRHKYNMHDIINITHAKSDVINKFQRGELESPETWEVKISTSDNEDARESEWINLVKDGKLGYLALIRNLRNIISCKDADDEFLNKYLVTQIENKEAIKKSLVFPYQIYTAYKAISNQYSCLPLSILVALNNAFKISICNMPKLEGKSLIVADVSGSMTNSYSGGSLTIIETCAVYAAAMLLSDNDFDLIKFGSDAKYRNYKNTDNPFNLISKICDNENMGHSTLISTVFEIMDKHYDRIILFSDMQIMKDNYYCKFGSTKELFNSYIKEYGDCKIYSFDLGNYPSQLTNNDSHIKYITILNDKVFDAIKLMEQGDKSLIDIIKNYKI